MIVTRLRLTNWKNFRAVDVALRERIFVVGPNASGKSNLLDVFRFLRDLARPRGGGLQQAVASRGGLSKIRCLAARQNPLVEVDVELGEPGAAVAEWRYAIGIRQENKGKRRTMLAYEQVWKNGVRILDSPKNEGVDRDDEQLTETYLESPKTNQKFRQLAEYFSAISYLHLVPQLLRSVKSAELEQAGEDFHGRNFLVRVAKTPEQTRKKRLQRTLEALSKAVPQFKELKDEKDAAGIPHLLMRLEHWRPDAGWQNEEQFSDGTIRMLGLFWAMQEGDSMLLFEEPELSLNDRIVAELPALLWRLQASRGRQVLATTHSYSLLSDEGIAPEEVLLLEPNKEGTKVVEAGALPDVVAMVKSGATIGDAVLPRATPEHAHELAL
jgi:predicted ATPase